MSETDIPVFPADLMPLIGITHTGTLRKQIKAGKLPDFDKKISQKTRYWFRSTLVEAGVLPPDQATANPPTPASDVGAPA